MIESDDKNESVVIEPGDQFDVPYGNGKRCTVVALSVSGQRKLAGLLREMIVAEKDQDPVKCIDLFDQAEEALRLAIPGVDQEFLDGIDAQFAIEIAKACLSKQAIGDDDRKKSE